MSDPLATAEMRRGIWGQIWVECVRRWFRRPWRRYWFDAAREAWGYTTAEDPPRDWPNGNPAMRDQGP